MKGYSAYKDAFQRLAAAFRSKVGIDGSDVEAVVETNKRLDHALLAFGQFLGTYDR
jgi:hypothetical protein